MITVSLRTRCVITSMLVDRYASFNPVEGFRIESSEGGRIETYSELAGIIVIANVRHMDRILGCRDLDIGCAR